jgi:hypothetical protein
VQSYFPSSPGGTSVVDKLTSTIAIKSHEVVLDASMVALQIDKLVDGLGLTIARSVGLNPEVFGSVISIYRTLVVYSECFYTF